MNIHESGPLFAIHKGIIHELFMEALFVSWIIHFMNILIHLFIEETYTLQTRPPARHPYN